MKGLSISKSIFLLSLSVKTWKHFSGRSNFCNDVPRNPNHLTSVTTITIKIIIIIIIRRWKKRYHIENSPNPFWLNQVCKWEEWQDHGHCNQIFPKQAIVICLAFVSPWLEWLGQDTFYPFYKYFYSFFLLFLFIFILTPFRKWECKESDCKLCLHKASGKFRLQTIIKIKEKKGKEEIETYLFLWQECNELWMIFLLMDSFRHWSAWVWWCNQTKDHQAYTTKIIILN